LTAVAVKYPELQKMGVEILSVSTDSRFSHKIWQAEELSKMVPKGVPYPMLSDPGGEIGKVYGVYDEASGVDFRGRFLIDPDGVIQRNAAFYMCASDCAQDPVAKAMFKALWRTEAEHASLICKILKVPKPEIKPDDKACLRDPKANFAASHQREKSAVVFYGRSANEATEDRVKEVFTALSAVETYHIALSGARK
jgi:peroxiredoxin